MNLTMLIQTQDNEMHKHLADVCQKSGGRIILNVNPLCSTVCLSIMCWSSVAPNFSNALFYCKPLGSSFPSKCIGCSLLARLQSLCCSDVCRFVFQS